MNRRRLAVRLALLFAVVQVVVVGGILATVPALRTLGPASFLLVGFLVVDIVLLAFVAVWTDRASALAPISRVAADVQRIADGDYRHRVSDPVRPDLREIQRSVNRLADRLIADQRLLAENVESLDRTNRALIRARDQVVQSARMASVGSLAAGIAHEVGNPLGAILGFVDVARLRVASEGGDVEILDSIRSEAKRIDRIVRGLLDYARPSEGGGEPDSAEAVVARVREILESQGALEGIEVSWTVQSASERLLDQPRRLEQVMVNLLLNARHAVRAIDAPRVDVAVGEDVGELYDLPRRREDDPPGINYRHRRRASMDEESVASVQVAARVTVIEVVDNGYGIPEDVLDRLFDPFFTTKEPGEGTGLGLSVCARLVEGMGGRIDAENRPEGGARFVIRLPVLYDTPDDDATDPTDRVRS